MASFLIYVNRMATLAADYGRFSGRNFVLLMRAFHIENMFCVQPLKTEFKDER